MTSRKRTNLKAKERRVKTNTKYHIRVLLTSFMKFSHLTLINSALFQNILECILLSMIDWVWVSDMELPEVVMLRSLLEFDLAGASQDTWKLQRNCSRNCPFQYLSFSYEIFPHISKRQTSFANFMGIALTNLPRLMSMSVLLLNSDWLVRNLYRS